MIILNSAHVCILGVSMSCLLSACIAFEHGRFVEHTANGRYPVTSPSGAGRCPCKCPWLSGLHQCLHVMHACGCQHWLNASPSLAFLVTDLADNGLQNHIYNLTLWYSSAAPITPPTFEIVKTAQPRWGAWGCHMAFRPCSRRVTNISPVLMKQSTKTSRRESSSPR